MESNSKASPEASRKLVYIEYEISDEPLKDEYIRKLPRHAQKKARRLMEDLYVLTMADPKNAIPELEKAMITYPNYPKLYNFIGNAYERTGRLEQAREIVIENLKKNPDYLFAKLNYAELLFRYGEYEKIPDVFDGKLELKTLYPSRNRFHTSEVAGFAGIIGAYLCMIGETTGAKVYYELLQKIDPDSIFTKRLKKLLYPSVMTKLYKNLMITKQAISKAVQVNEGSGHGKEF